jgi:hypothetical protein
MNTYQLQDGTTLVVSVDNRAWETITFVASDFRDMAAATAEELVQVLNRSEGLAASVDVQGCVVLATAVRGGHTSLEIDLTLSTAAAALGLAGRPARAQGEGLRAARLVSLAAEPFALPSSAAMTIIVDGQELDIAFDSGLTAGQATAAEVVQVINAQLPKTADITRTGQVMLTSPSIGIGSTLAVRPGEGEGKTDAAAILGFIGAAAFDEPHKVEPARIVCSGRQMGLQAVNLTASPIELHLPTGTTVLPARGSVALLPGEVANSQLQRFIGQGVVRLTSVTDA